MRFVHAARVITALAAVLLSGVATSATQVNGNATITASALGQPLSISTSSQFAGAISSIRWGNKEFINDWDHGRQLQLNAQFFNRFECYNPYEAGSIQDQDSLTSSSLLLSLSASGNSLQSETQMAWYLPRRESIPADGDECGDPTDWFPVPPYTGPLSNYRVHKTVTIGFAGIPNVIEYLTQLYVPEQVQKGINQAVAVMPYEFSSIWSYDVVSKDYRKIRSPAGEDDRIKVVSTADGSYAMGFYAPELLQPYGDPGTASWWFVVPPDPFHPDPYYPSLPDPDYACVHVGSFNRYNSFDGPGYKNDRAYLVIGSLDQVKSTLSNLHNQFRALDPDVYDWRDYLAINGVQSALPTQEAAENHWLSQGIAQGLTASRTFSASQYLQLNPDVANAFGAANYQGAIDHYVSAGRAEGRGTVAKPAAGMQHLLVLTNRSAVASGQNTFGQEGNGTLSQSPGPTQVSFDPTMTEVAAGDYTSFAVKNDGSLWMWGSNQYGARGDGSSGDIITTPVQVPIPARISTPSRSGKHAIAVGTAAYAAIDTNGQVWMWGVNWNGRLGDGTTTSRYTPARVRKSANPDDYLTGIVSIAAGGGTMAAIDADSTVWTWGAGASGALGNGFTQDSSYPVQVVQAASNNELIPLFGVSQVACGSSGFCIALMRYGEVFGWGSNEFSQMGIAPGGAFSIATPIIVQPNLPIDAIAAGSAHCIVHSSADGNVYGWGYNGRGQLGTGSATVAQFPPAQMTPGPDSMSQVSELAAGADFSVMVRYVDRAVFVAGDNQSGQLALFANPASQYVPVGSSF
jgi:alpha-tubulin suppressor-like RCC1 family protein